MGGVSTNMLKHLKEECPNISEEIRNSLHDLNNTNNNTNNSTKKNRNKRPRIETVELSDNGNSIFLIFEICV